MQSAGFRGRTRGDLEPVYAQGPKPVLETMVVFVIVITIVTYNGNITVIPRCLQMESAFLDSIKPLTMAKSSCLIPNSALCTFVKSCLGAINIDLV